MVRKILRYLKGTVDFGLTLESRKYINITGYADADWAIDPDDMRCAVGYCIFLGNNLISWWSKKTTYCVKI